MLINGDDIVFPCTKRGYEFWRRTTSAGGLDPSMGKNYTSAKFCVINSQYYAYESIPIGTLVFDRPARKLKNSDSNSSLPIETHVVPHHYRHSPFVNLGLLFGKKRVTNTELDLGVLTDNFCDLGSRLKDFIKGFDPVRQLELTRLFIKHNKNLLDRVPNGIPWFLPRTLGGLGFPMTFLPSCICEGEYDRHKCKLTIRDYNSLEQLKLARMFAEDKTFQDGIRLDVLAGQKGCSNVYKVALNLLNEMVPFSETDEHVPQYLPLVTLQTCMTIEPEFLVGENKHVKCGKFAKLKDWMDEPQKIRALMRNDALALNSFGEFTPPTPLARTQRFFRRYAKNLTRLRQSKHHYLTPMSIDEVYNFKPKVFGPTLPLLEEYGVVPYV
jgi:hypothetical protein